MMTRRVVIGLLIVLGLGLIQTHSAFPHETTTWTWEGQEVLATDICRTEYIVHSEEGIQQGGATEVRCEEVATPHTEQHGWNIEALALGLLIAGGALAGLFVIWARSRRF
ncbi:hypothetical protein SAMN05216270_107222 [Glycomyces harbinensis]|uniref:Uncharacterized protein n=2 Tax=Glycomyces harbinensis TaxID=58114 RepID=A0A1G6XML0_9ACTN|nr:hypothetical protein SAMN05216270_107222 [Glycomyces harbinensis]